MRGDPRTAGWYSTGQVARALRVGVSTVHKWCDNGTLPHYHLPFSKHRRVRACDLAAFCRRWGLEEMLNEELRRKGPP